MICDHCYYKIDCHKKPTEDDRCGYYVKGVRVKLKEDSEVNPMDTTEFDVDDVRKLFEEIERRR